MRVNAVMRRIKKYEKMGNHNIRVGQVELLPTEMQVVMPNGKTVQLTRTEMRVLRLLMLSPGQVIHRDHILSEVWGDDESTSNSVDVYIHRLRTKLETDPDHPEYIVSVRGSGYKFVGK